MLAAGKDRHMDAWPNGKARDFESRIAGSTPAASARGNQLCQLLQPRKRLQTGSGSTRTPEQPRGGPGARRTGETSGEAPRQPGKTGTMQAGQQGFNAGLCRANGHSFVNLFCS